MREVLTDQSFAASTLGLSHDFHHHHHHLQHSPPRSCEDCGADHGHEDRLDFPEDSYEDEPDEEESEGDDDDLDDRDHDHGPGGHHDDYVEDSLDDEDYDDDDEQDVVDGYSHHYEENNVKMMAYEEEKLKMETVRRVREEERRIKEELRKKRMSERLRQKQEKGIFSVLWLYLFQAPRIAFLFCSRRLTPRDFFLSDCRTYPVAAATPARG